MKSVVPAPDVFCKVRKELAVEPPASSGEVSDVDAIRDATTALIQSCGTADNPAGLHLTVLAAMLASLLLPTTPALIVQVEELSVQAKSPDTAASTPGVSAANGIACAGPGPMPVRPTTGLAGKEGGNCRACATVGKIDRAAQRAKSEPTVAAIFFMPPRCRIGGEWQRTKGGWYVAGGLSY